jgi:hypothetical protein
VPSRWTLEMAQFAMVAYYILGGPYSIQMGSNVRMDLFYGDWSAKRKAWFDALTVLLPDRFPGRADLRRACLAGLFAGLLGRQAAQFFWGSAHRQRRDRPAGNVTPVVAALHVADQADHDLASS